MKKKGMILWVAISIICAVSFWFMYSLILFNGFFLPSHVVGLSNSYVYYQKYIGMQLLRYGQEYKIDKGYFSNWKMYKDNNFGFEFKYPENLILTDLNGGHYIEIENVDDTNKKCKLEIEDSGWEIGKNWLLRKRRRIENEIKSNQYDDLYYIKKENGDVFRIQMVDNFDKIKFASVIFISNKKPFKFIKVSDYQGVCSEDLIKDMLASFRFVR